ncbi:MAG: membrane protein insertion efficiency factor YidD [Alphaproteobacteria bacterium]|nr:membrane protein insertion efficiency factor YidD [Alphaproteobacteria bacterium]
MKFLLINLVKTYRFLLSPLTGQNCRFHPTCSAYMIEAIEIHGVIKGLMLGIIRIFKCHPYYKGDMIDPVPFPAKHLKSKDCASHDDRL